MSQDLGQSRGVGCRGVSEGKQQVSRCCTAHTLGFGMPYRTVRTGLYGMHRTVRHAHIHGCLLAQRVAYRAMQRTMCVESRIACVLCTTQFLESLIRAFPLIEVSIRTSSRKLRSVLDVFYQAVKTGGACGREQCSCWVGSALGNVACIDN
jgi:hypothetical protein